MIIFSRKTRLNIIKLLESFYYYILIYKEVDRGYAIKNRYYTGYSKSLYIINYKVKFRPPLY